MPYHVGVRASVLPRSGRVRPAERFTDVEFDFAAFDALDFSSMSAADLRAEADRVGAALDEYGSMDPDDMSDDDVTAVEKLGEAAVKVRDARSARSKAGKRTERAVGAFAVGRAALDLFAADGDDDEDGDDEDGEAAPADPPATRTRTRQAAPTPPTVAAVAAAAGRNPVDQVEGETREVLRLADASMVAAAGAPGYVAGQAMSWDDAGKVVESHFRSYSGITASAGGALPASRRDGVLQIRVKYPDELRVIGDGDASSVLAYAADERNLPGGSLLASIDLAAKRGGRRTQVIDEDGRPVLNADGQALTAAGVGWCAPSQVVYDLCELESADGLWDGPEVTIDRGGMKHTTGPDFASIYSGSGYFHYTEAEIISGVTKPCMAVPCPTFVDDRLAVDGLCIQSDLLQLRGYPEMIGRFTRGALIAHQHRMNAYRINAMVVGSTAGVLPSGVASHTPILATSTWGTDHSVLSMVLASIDLAITDFKYRSRMRQSATLEVVMPYWVLSWIRTDMVRRAFYDGEQVDQFAITVAKIEQWFRVRSARVQWVYDWQDAFYWTSYATGAPSAWQRMGSDPTTTDFVQDWPHTVQFLLYAAGTWVAGNADVINLDTVYDSTLLAQNKATQLFTEQGLLMAKTCPDARVYTIAGGTGGLVPSGAHNYAPTAQPAWTNP